MSGDEGSGARPLVRRTFVIGAGRVGAGLALGAFAGACSGPDSPATYTGDFAVIARAAALENQAVSVYRATLAAVQAGRLRGAAPAFVSLAQACLRQHAEHARTWNAILRSARKPAVSGAPGHSLASSIASARTIGVATAAALRVEDEATQAHAAAAGRLTLAAGVAAAASIAPVEAMHAAILRFIMGEFPTPVSFTGFPAAAG